LGFGQPQGVALSVPDTESVTSPNLVEIASAGMECGI
jgi:hypothetical protein